MLAGVDDVKTPLNMTVVPNCKRDSLHDTLSVCFRSEQVQCAYEASLGCIVLMSLTLYSPLSPYSWPSTSLSQHTCAVHPVHILIPNTPGTLPSTLCWTPRLSRTVPLCSIRPCGALVTLLMGVCIFRCRHSQCSELLHLGLKALYPVVYLHPQHHATSATFHRPERQ